MTIDGSIDFTGVTAGSDCATLAGCSTTGSFGMNDIGSTPRPESPPHAAIENSNAHRTWNA